MGFDRLRVAQQRLKPSIPFNPGFGCVREIGSGRRQFGKKLSAGDDLRGGAIGIQPFAIHQHTVMERHDVLQPGLRCRITRNIRPVERLHPVHDIDGVGHHFTADLKRWHDRFWVERHIPRFELLVGVSSIGPRLALNMLSSIEAVKLQQAISHSDVATLQMIPGIGRKTAERVVLELQEKVLLVHVTSGTPSQAASASDTDQLAGDVLSALLNLGYKRGEAEKAVRATQNVTNGPMTLETLLKDALQQLAR